MIRYRATFQPEDNGYNVTFPDFPECYTCGSSYEEALYMAKDVLIGWLITYKYDLKKPFPVSTEGGGVWIEIDKEIDEKNFETVSFFLEDPADLTFYQELAKQKGMAWQQLMRNVLSWGASFPALTFPFSFLSTSDTGISP